MSVRWYAKANAYAEAWLSTLGRPPSVDNVALGLAVAEHETRCGDAWAGEHNWGACTKGRPSPLQLSAIRAAGVVPVLPTKDDPHRHERAAEAATKALVAAGCPPATDQAIHVDSAPSIGPYFTFFGKFPDDVAGAVYFVHVLAETRASCRAVLERGGGVAELAAAMFHTRYYTGVHRDDPDANIRDYSAALAKFHPGIVSALASWSPGADPPPEYTEPAAPPDLTTVLGVQRALNRLEAAGLTEDGILGPKTKAAIVAFQRARGLVVDGIVGPKTRAALAAALARLA